MSHLKIRKHPECYNVYVSGSLKSPKLYTKNIIKGNQVYGEKLIIQENKEFRTWDPYRSKLAAILMEDSSINFLKQGLKCLYLGAASGTTVSHLSDILINGIIYAVEFAERSMRQLIQNTYLRNNIIPILGDARKPSQFAKYIFTEIDSIYQDVAQPNQAEIAIKNAEYYLKERGILILAIKSQSIDSITKPKKIYKREIELLEEAGLEIINDINIHKYAANHIVLIVQKKIN